ncbi:hypothetical protein [Flavobacterium sp.]|uniref:hypothetical protein n=1 Tax=Flavobacterium sp. TaxID=239 RepID=UPI00286D139A|nr:hypothetical protein [Flavobacterium sp.]
MSKHSVFICLLFFSLTSLVAQNIEKLKLVDNEIPKEYTLTENDNAFSIQARLFYKNPDMYSMIIGKVKNKEVQNFQSSNDSGSIMYFEFEENFTVESFLKGLLWGQSKKPTNDHPEEFFVKGNLLIIWSFTKNSALKLLSKNKIESLLK